MCKIGDTVFIEKLAQSIMYPNTYLIINKKYHEDSLKLYSYDEYLLLNICNYSRVQIKIWNNKAFTEYKLIKCEISWKYWICSIYPQILLNLKLISTSFDSKNDNNKIDNNNSINNN